MPETSPNAVSALVSQFWVQFKDKIFERLTVLEQAVGELSRGTLDEELRKSAAGETHKLAGSLGMFGLIEASGFAHETEQLLSEDMTKLAASLPRLQELAGALRMAVVRGPENPKPATTSTDPYFLVVDGDVELAQNLTNEAIRFGLQGGAAHSVAAARKAIVKRIPNVVLLELGGKDDLAESLNLLEELSQLNPPVPAIVFSNRDGLVDRVEAARRGARGFLQKPLATHAVLQAVSDALETAHAHQYQVLALDDDIHFLKVLEKALAPEKVRLTTATTPASFWEMLELTSPDLVILDVEVPGINGVELCRVLRTDSRWNQIPVMFLTGHIDTETVKTVYAAGADDFVSKSLVKSELVTRMLNRLKRSEAQRKSAETDPLTGIANRKKFCEIAQKLLRLAERQQRPFTFAILDLDHFKQVNDRFGHDIGDEVLRRMGELLSVAFRTEDVVGRWGGEEFCIGMYGMSRSLGVNRLSALLDRFRSTKVRAGNDEVSASFSCGVAQFPDDGLSLDELYRAADAALYQAKAAGRSRVLGAGAK